MTAHVLVFVGATPSLSSELLTLKKRLQGVEVIAPAAAKGQRGITAASVDNALAAVSKFLKSLADNTGRSRLSAWAYEPNAAAQHSLMWEAFGTSAWIEFVPPSLADKPGATRALIEQRNKTVLQMLHEVSHQAFNQRKSTPLILPLRNFRGKVANELKSYWYNGADLTSLRFRISKMGQRLRQHHVTSERTLADERRLIFAPAEDGACHGKPHPTGHSDKCFVSGRFRFGAALYPGFHYDVSQGADRTLDCILYDCSGVAREMRSERREYINVFSNDFLLPEKGPHKSKERT